MGGWKDNPCFTVGYTIVIFLGGEAGHSWRIMLSLDLESTTFLKKSRFILLSPSSTDQKNKTALLLIEVVYIHILPFLVVICQPNNNNFVTSTRLKTQRMEWRKCWGMASLKPPEEVVKAISDLFGMHLGNQQPRVTGSVFVLSIFLMQVPPCVDKGVSLEMFGK